MNDYAQPDFYKFNQDSIALINHLKIKHLFPKSILDLGAGCGIIGIELQKKFNSFDLALVEAQHEFREYLEINLKGFGLKESNQSLIIESFSGFFLEKKFDLIVSNPPYFLPGTGKSSSSSNRDTCRHFRIDSIEILLNCIHRHLSYDGMACLVFRRGLDIVRNLYHPGLETRLIHEGELIFVELIHLNEDRRKRLF
jgi:tRNA1(Val) A37 N6-methylase TrmN6